MYRLHSRSVTAEVSSLGLERMLFALFMSPLSESGYGLDVGCPELVESTVVVMRQGSWWPVWLAGQLGSSPQ